MKANAKELFEVIRQVVRDEISKSVPEMISRHLSEEYIKKALTEKLSERQPERKQKTNSSLAELLTVNSNVDEDEIPAPKKNVDRGIYNDNNMSKNENVRKLQQSLGANIFEGVKLPGEESEMPDVPVEDLTPDFSRMNRLLEATSSKGPMQLSGESRMRELEMKRRALDVPAVVERK